MQATVLRLFGYLDSLDGPLVTYSVFVCLASPSILLVFFCVFCPELPQLCTLLGSFSFSWFPFPGSGSP